MRIVLALALAFTACTTEGFSPEARTAELRGQYPAGKTTRADVTAKWGDAPEIALARPSGGWTQPLLVDAERRTGMTIARAERYVTPDGTSAGLLTLSRTWFFYDASDVVVDVEFERQGD